MSLSFVSSAILSSSDGISHNEEQNIESNEATTLRSKDTSDHVPLFEQIRKNKDLEQQKSEEEFKARQMGTRGLDEEDCAHLESLESMREAKERLLKKREMEEVDLFRAARAERSFKVAAKTSLIHEEEEKEIIQKDPVQKPAKKAIVAPIIVKKKRRIGNDDPDKTKDGATVSSEHISSNNDNKCNDEERNKNTKNEGAAAISSLLGAYDSDDSDNDSD